MKTKILLPFLALNMVLGIVAGILIAITQQKLLWAGAMLAAVSGPLYLILVVGSGRVARTSAKLPFMQLANALGALIVIYAVIFLEQQWSATIAALVICASGVVFVQWYVRIFSSYNRRKSQSIVKGQSLPEVLFEQLDGQVISSASFVGKKTLIVFFRGSWCPLCVAQLKEVVSRADKLSELGVLVHFVSNQSPEKLRLLSKKLKLPKHIEILFDRDLRAAKSLAIEDINGTPLGMLGYPRDTVMATVIALDHEGRVIFGDQTDNYRVRPHPDTFLAVFES